MASGGAWPRPDPAPSGPGQGVGAATGLDGTVGVGPQMMWAAGSYRCPRSGCSTTVRWCSTSGCPAKNAASAENAALRVVVATGETAPPSAVANRPSRMIVPSVNPFAAVRSPTTWLRLNVPPAGRVRVRRGELTGHLGYHLGTGSADHDPRVPSGAHRARHQRKHLGAQPRTVDDRDEPALRRRVLPRLHGECRSQGRGCEVGREAGQLDGDRGDQPRPVRAQHRGDVTAAGQPQRQPSEHSPGGLAAGAGRGDRRRQVEAQAGLRG